MLKSLLGRLLRRMGYQAIPTQELPSINFALHLRRLLTSQNIETVFDVGANRGQYRDFLRKQVGFTGRILSFEPISHLHLALSERAKTDPMWQIYPFALGDKEETLKINIMAADDFSSFLSPNNEGTARFEDSNRVAKKEAVRVRRLDDVYKEVAQEFRLGRAYLKLDTQGYDFNALRGSAGILKEIIALQTEASVIPLYEGMPSYRDTFDFLGARSFELGGTFPVTYDEQLRLIEFDCIFVNTPIIKPLQLEKKSQTYRSSKRTGTFQVGTTLANSLLAPTTTKGS